MDMRILQHEDIFIKCLMDKYKMQTCLFRTTSDCNMRCKYCYQHKSHKTYLNEKHLDKIANYLDKLYSVRNEELDPGYSKFIFIGGEISMSDINLELLKKIESVNIKEAVYLCACTNGLEIDDKFMEFLEYAKNSKINCAQLDVQVSLDINKEIHDFNRPDIDKNPTYDRILNNITKLHKLGYEVGTNAVVDKVVFNNHSYNKVFNDLKNTLPEIRKRISVDYSSFIHRQMTDKEREFLLGLLDSQKDYLIECLETTTEAKIDIVQLKMECLLYSLLYFNRHFCDVDKGHAFEAISDEDIVVSKCNCYTYSETENLNVTKFNTYRSDKEIVDITQAVLGDVNELECEHCHLRPFCFQICPRLTFDGKCVKSNKEIAIMVRDNIRKVMSMDGFIEKYSKYLELYGEEGEYYSWTVNNDFWLEKIKAILDLDLKGGKNE